MSLKGVNQATMKWSSGGTRYTFHTPVWTFIKAMIKIQDGSHVVILLVISTYFLVIRLQLQIILFLPKYIFHLIFQFTKGHPELVKYSKPKINTNIFSDPNSLFVVLQY